MEAKTDILKVDITVTFGNPVDRSNVVKRGIDRKNSDEISDSLKIMCKKVKIENMTRSIIVEDNIKKVDVWNSCERERVSNLVRK